jgi:ureidoacrylate peracid hydrolase
MSHHTLDATRTGLLIVDLQNDFLDPRGAYGRAGQSAPAIAALPQKILPLAQALRAKGGCPGAWGHQLVDVLQPADLTVEKVAYSAFYMTRMEWVLRKAGIETLLVCGIVTNGGVASTVRDAHVRDFDVRVLEDGCAAFSAETHSTAIDALRPVAPVLSLAEALQAVEQA